MRLYKLVSEGVDIVLVVGKDKLAYDERQTMIEEATESADLHGEVSIEDSIEIPDGWLDAGRPFVG